MTAPTPADTPFATPEEVSAGWRPLDTVASANALFLLKAVAMWIRARRPDITDNDPAAKFVSIDVVRSAMQNAGERGATAFSKAIGPWNKSITLSQAAGMIVFSAFHKQLLGIGGEGEPLFSFKVCDY